MKKILALMFITGIITFFACGPNANEKAQIKKEIMDSINKADSLAHVLKLDSLAKAKHILDSINNSAFIDTRDSKKYKIITLGTQVWMTENLRYKVSSGCWAYDNNESNANKYGYLYDWETAVNVCPTGWHLPADVEWTTLINNLGGENVAGGKLKATTSWESPNTGATNSSGFTALPGGIRYDNRTFNNIGFLGGYWSSTASSTNKAWVRDMTFEYSGVHHSGSSMDFGYSIRCIKN